jgi:hypothetical protein
MAPVAWLMAGLLLLTALVHLVFAVVPPLPGHLALLPRRGVMTEAAWVFWASFCWPSCACRWRWPCRLPASSAWG